MLPPGIIGTSPKGRTAVLPEQAKLLLASMFPRDQDILPGRQPGPSAPPLFREGRELLSALAGTEGINRMGAGTPHFCPLA